MHKQSLLYACQELKTLMGTEGYTSDSSEKQDAKIYIQMLSEGITILQGPRKIILPNLKWKLFLLLKHATN